MVNRKLTNEDILRRLKHLPKTIQCGLHSGFPPCCILFYINKKMWMTGKQNKAYMNRLHNNKKYQAHCVLTRHGYIACPKCLKNGTFVKVRSCPKNKHCNHSEEQAGEWMSGIIL